MKRPTTKPVRRVTGISFSPAEREALAWAIDLATDDQEHLLSNGNPEVDYGAEWPETARTKAAMFNRLAAICKTLGDHGTANNCSAMAEALESAAVRYEEEHGE